MTALIAFNDKLTFNTAGMYDNNVFDLYGIINNIITQSCFALRTSDYLCFVILTISIYCDQ